MTPRRLPLLLAAAWVVLALAVLAAGFSGVSGDDFFKALTVHEWLKRPAFHAGALPHIAILWLPAPVWLAGALCALTGGLLLPMTLLSLAAGAAALFALFRLAEGLFGRTAGILAVLLAGLLPAFTWLGVSTTEMTLYYAALLGGVLGLTRWDRDRRPAALWGGAVSFLLATMFRTEAWVPAAFFSAWIGLPALARGLRPADRAARLAAAALPMLFAAAWLARNQIDYGHPLYFLRFSRAITQDHAGIGGLPRWMQAGHGVFLLFIVSPLLFALSAAGVLAGWRRRGRAAWLVLAVAGVQFAALLAASAYGAGTKAFPQRYVLADVLLLVPFAAGLLARGAASRRARPAVAAFLVLYTAVHGARLFRFPTRYRDVAAAGRFVARGRATPGPVCSELGFRKLLGERLDAETDFLVLASSHVALMVTCGAPEAVLFGAGLVQADEKAAWLAPGPAGGTVDGPALDARLRAHGVTTLVLERRESMARVPARYRLAELRDGAAVFETDARAGPRPRLSTAARIRPLRAEVLPGLALAGAGTTRGPFPDVLALAWRVDPGAARPAGLRLRLRFRPAGRPDRAFEREVPSVLAWIGPDAATAEGLVPDPVGLSLPAGFPPGRYRVGLSVAADGGPAPGSAPIDLGEVTLLGTKREALVAALRGRLRDPALLAHLLLSL